MSTLSEQVNELESLLTKLPAGDRKFADSLINGKWGFRARGKLSLKQAGFIPTLLERAKNPPVAKTEEVGAIDGLIAIFNKAKVHLKYPKIRLALKEGTEVVLSLCGPRAKAPGSVNVSNGLPFGAYGQKWYGRVSPDGVWEQARREFEELPEVGELLVAMSKDPAGTAAAHGRLHGKCCFCNSGLKDERSTEVGYGPTCAKHYGLPWG